MAESGYQQTSQSVVKKATHSIWFDIGASKSAIAKRLSKVPDHARVTLVVDGDIDGVAEIVFEEEVCG